MRYNKSIDCACGNKVDLEDLLDDVRDEALDDGESGNLKDEIECDECGATYQVSASARVEVEVFVESIELMSQGVVVDGVAVNIDQFVIGDVVELPDGEYQAGNMMYAISNGVVSNIYNAQIDENQLALAI